MYNEEELLEAIDILIEEYGYDEDEAIELVNEALTLGSTVRGMSGMYKDAVNTRDRYKNLKDTPSHHSPEEIKQARNDFYKSTGKAAAATAVGAAALTFAAKDAKDKLPKLRAKLERQRRMKQRIKRMKRRMRSY